MLRALRHEPLSRAQLVESTGWSRNTVATRLDELLAGGWVSEVSFGAGERGRPFLRYRANPRAAMVYVAVLGWDQVHGAICGLDGEPLAIEVHPHRLETLPDAIETCRQQLARLLTLPAVAGETVLAAAIGAPNHVANQIDMAAWSLAGPLADQFTAALGVPTTVDNDANLMALGLRRKFADVDSFVFVKIATGVGAGIVVGGRLHSGVAGLAGEIGHIPVRSGGDRQCSCGNRGCMADQAAVPGVLRKLSAGGRIVSDLDELQALVTSGDGEAVAALRSAGRDIGEALVGVVTAIAPEVLVMGGRMTQLGDHLTTGVRESLTRYTLPALSSRIRVTTTTKHRTAGLRGGADLAFDRLLAD